MSASNQPRDIFSGITDWFSCICEPQACGPRAAFDEHEPASNAPLRVDDERFAIMASDDGIQQSFKAYSSTSAKGRAIERGNFPAFCRHFFTRIDPTYTLTSEDMNLLWEFFDRQREGRLDIFQFGVAVKQLLQNRAGKRGLIMVDFQKDFVDGSLKVAEGIDAVRQANMVRDKFDQDLIWLTRCALLPNCIRIRQQDPYTRYRAMTAVSLFRGVLRVACGMASTSLQQLLARSWPRSVWVRACCVIW
jgi:hypothetical protein